MLILPGVLSDTMLFNKVIKEISSQLELQLKILLFLG